MGARGRGGGVGLSPVWDQRRKRVWGPPEAAREEKTEQYSRACTYRCGSRPHCHPLPLQSTLAPQRSAASPRLRLRPAPSPLPTKLQVPRLVAPLCSAPIAVPAPPPTPCAPPLSALSCLPPSFTYTPLPLLAALDSPLVAPVDRCSRTLFHVSASHSSIFLFSLAAGVWIFLLRVRVRVRFSGCGSHREVESVSVVQCCVVLVGE